MRERAIASIIVAMFFLATWLIYEAMIALDRNETPEVKPAKCYIESEDGEAQQVGCHLVCSSYGCNLSLSIDEAKPNG